MTERELISDLAQHGTLLAITGQGLLYGAAEAHTATCPSCNRCAAFYVLRQATAELVAELGELGRGELGWVAACLTCSAAWPPSVRQRPDSHHAPRQERQEPPGSHLG